jgi:hypothetical protein
MPWRDGKVIRMRAICLRRPHLLLVSCHVMSLLPAPPVTSHHPSGQRQPKPRPLVSSRLDPPQLGICLALTGKHVLSMSFGASSRLLCCLPCPSSSSIPPPTTSSTILSNHMNNVVQTTYDPSSTLPQPPHSPPLSPRPYRWGTCV